MKSLAFKQSIKLALLFGVLLPLTAAPVLANAAGTSTSGTGSSTVTSPKPATASVEITGGNLEFGNKNGIVETPSFNFGQVMANASAQNVRLKGTNEDENLVVDNLTNKDGGWKVGVTLTTFKGKNSSLGKGAQLNFKSGGATGSENKEPTFSNTSVIPDDPETTLLEAKNGEGKGEITLPLSSTTLDIPAVLDSDTYTASLTYTLKPTVE